MSYRGSNYKCHFSPIRTPVAANISGVVKLPANQYSPLMNAVATLGPISISVDASAWHEYESGVFTGCNATNIDINHAVVLVGYGTDSKSGDYWLVRNSWAPTWGEQGYIRIARSSSPKCGVDNSPLDGTGCKGGPSSVSCCGECGILYDSSYPIVYPVKP
jgi:cathepsin L